ncbi:MAG: 4-hydroxy-tetrahydrodipicolinate reductase [Muribaculaceae bacterium]|nr:4-hydroxy-tetrahydrodipicolinate reductase [Muribaculaceae bacterium]
MKIAIIGHGKMGREVEKVALSRGHEIVCIIDCDNRDDFQSEAFRSADVAIEFSVPAAGMSNVLASFAENVPVVSGTTGWLDEAAAAEIAKCCAEGGTLLHATNFSLGVNVTMAANRLLARLLAPYPEYHASLEEVHHIHKLDHPSGTAITLSEQLVNANDRYCSWAETDIPAPGVLPVRALREGEVPGIHTVTWTSSDDSITLRHEAKSRHGFTVGAVVAAEWLAKAPRGHRYSMADVLGLSDI